ncbi:hypothetical protein QR680_006490 [Steinernema hermaphroditum]|uniref:Saposin B-type domain-containing protein n=1 Tax=Steinernema hermaphroditum TaxID=289476 RepID=A0AA39LX89_9BILA|nr:hypothetical protein QR680_006490 [Steinernema hermaphroditum]
MMRVLFCVALIPIAVSASLSSTFWKYSHLGRYRSTLPTGSHRLSCEECVEKAASLKDNIDSWWMQYVFPNVLELWCGLETGFNADICLPALDCILRQLNITIHRYTPKKLCSTYNYCPGPSRFDILYCEDCKRFYDDVEEHGDEGQFEEIVKNRQFHTCMKATEDFSLACFLQCEPEKRKKLFRFAPDSDI